MGGQLCEHMGQVGGRSGGDGRLPVVGFPVVVHVLHDVGGGGLGCGVACDGAGDGTPVGSGGYPGGVVMADWQPGGHGAALAVLIGLDAD